MKSQRCKQGETQKSELESHVSNVCIFKSLPLAKSFNEKLNGNIKDHNVLESIIFVRMDLVCYQYGVYNHRHNILTTLQGFSPVSIHNT